MSNCTAAATASCAASSNTCTTKSRTRPHRLRRPDQKGPALRSLALPYAARSGQPAHAGRTQVRGRLIVSFIGVRRSPVSGRSPASPGFEVLVAFQQRGEVFAVRVRFFESLSAFFQQAHHFLVLEVVHRLFHLLPQQIFFQRHLDLA